VSLASSMASSSSENGITGATDRSARCTPSACRSYGPRGRSARRTGRRPRRRSREWHPPRERPVDELDQFVALSLVLDRAERHVPRSRRVANHERFGVVDEQVDVRRRTATRGQVAVDRDADLSLMGRRNRTRRRACFARGLPSSVTTKGALPPSSRAAARGSRQRFGDALPTAVEPVKKEMTRVGWPVIRSSIAEPRPVTTLTTPSGNAGRFAELRDEQPTGDRGVRRGLQDDGVTQRDRGCEGRSERCGSSTAR